MKLFNQQSGDTLIEVTIAITIVATILTSAIALSTRAVRLGIAARERSQAALLLQQQAEGLRSLRDTKSWNDFTTSIPASPFHIEKIEPSPGVFTWDFANGTYVPVIDGQPTFFELRIETTGTVPPAPDRRDFVITATWERIGGGTDESVLYLHLANRDFVITYQEPALNGAIATSAEQTAYSRADLFRNREIRTLAFETQIQFLFEERTESYEPVRRSEYRRRKLDMRPKTLAECQALSGSRTMWCESPKISHKFIEGTA